MEWLHPYLAFSLCCGLITALLPRGSLRATATMVMGLLMTLCWLDCLRTLLSLPMPSAPASGVLTAASAPGYLARSCAAWADAAGR